MSNTVEAIIQIRVGKSRPWEECESTNLAPCYCGGMPRMLTSGDALKVECKSCGLSVSCENDAERIRRDWILRLRHHSSHQ